MIDVAALAARAQGRLVASGPAEPLRSPLDGSLTGSAPTSTAQDVVRAAATARAAQPAWAARPVAERAEVLLRFHDRLLDRLEPMADLIQAEAGKARLSAVEEVLHAAMTARYYGVNAPRQLRSERADGLLPAFTSVRRHYPAKGLIGVIGPWNYPLTMSVSDGLAAVAAGNAVLLKPDQRTPYASLVAVDLLEECGLPEGLWQVVHGPGAEVGPQLVDVVDYVCFTGSTATGRAVARQCADRLIGCSLELGGKNPALVLDDADLTRAVPGLLRGCFANSGQLCVAIERIYVARSRHQQFLDAFVTAVGEQHLGASDDYGDEIGGLIGPEQVDRVEEHVEQARSLGATVLTGGRRRPDRGPLYYEPTVLSGVTPEMTCYAEETFGPVVSVYAVDDDEAAVAAANDSPYGLNASVWTTDLERGARVAARLHCGTVNVNEAFAATFGSIDAPMGGMGRSGIGRRQSIEGIRRFVDIQAVAVQRGIPLAPTAGVSAAALVRGFRLTSRVLRRIGRA